MRKLRCRNSSCAVAAALAAQSQVLGTKVERKAQSLQLEPAENTSSTRATSARRALQLRIKICKFRTQNYQSNTRNAFPPAPAKNASFKHTRILRIAQKAGCFRDFQAGDAEVQSTTCVFLLRFTVATCKLGMMERALRRLFLRLRTASFELELQERFARDLCAQRLGKVSAKLRDCARVPLLYAQVAIL